MKTSSFCPKSGGWPAIFPTKCSQSLMLPDKNKFHKLFRCSIIPLFLTCGNPVFNTTLTVNILPHFFTTNRNQFLKRSMYSSRRENNLPTAWGLYHGISSASIRIINFSLPLTTRACTSLWCFSTSYTSCAERISLPFKLIMTSPSWRPALQKRCNWNSTKARVKYTSVFFPQETTNPVY